MYKASAQRDQRDHPISQVVLFEPLPDPCRSQVLQSCNRCHYCQRILPLDRGRRVDVGLISLTIAKM